MFDSPSTFNFNNDYDQMTKEFDFINCPCPPPPSFSPRPPPEPWTFLDPDPSRPVDVCIINSSSASTSFSDNFIYQQNSANNSAGGGFITDYRGRPRSELGGSHFGDDRNVGNEGGKEGDGSTPLGEVFWNSYMKKNPWIVYTLAAVIGLCIFAIIVTCIFLYCHRRNKLKQKSRSQSKSHILSTSTSASSAMRSTDWSYNSMKQLNRSSTVMTDLPPPSRNNDNLGQEHETHYSTSNLSHGILRHESYTDPIRSRSISRRRNPRIPASQYDDETHLSQIEPLYQTLSQQPDPSVTFVPSFHEVYSPSGGTPYKIRRPVIRETEMNSGPTYEEISSLMGGTRKNSFVTNGSYSFPANISAAYGGESFDVNGNRKCSINNSSYSLHRTKRPSGLNSNNDALISKSCYDCGECFSGHLPNNRNLDHCNYVTQNGIIRQNHDFSPRKGQFQYVPNSHCLDDGQSTAFSPMIKPSSKRQSSLPRINKNKNSKLRSYSQRAGIENDGNRNFRESTLPLRPMQLESDLI